MIKIGPAGIGKIEDSARNFAFYHKLGFKVAEILFTYGVYIKERRHKKEIQKIREDAEKFGIKLSIHAPYWINLNSDDKRKVEDSKKRILDSCRIGNLLNARKIVFHCGYYGKTDKGLSFDNIRKRILEMQMEVEKNKWDVELCPETMGRKNVFGSVEEIARLVKETGCSFCIDFAHVLARYGRYEFGLIKKSFPQREWHCHFSGISYSKAGEKHHEMAGISEWKKVLKGIPKNKDIEIICESPDPVGDSVVGIRVLRD